MNLGDAINACKEGLGTVKATRPSWAGRYFVVVFDANLKPPRLITDVFNADGTDAPNEFSFEDKTSEDWEVISGN